MPGYVLHQGMTIMCPHGGSGTLVPTAVRVKVDNKIVACEGDTTTIAGCAFNVSGAPSPCLTVQWQAPAVRVKAQGKAVLVSSSVGLCMSAANAPQGPATVSGYQTKVRAQ